MIPHICTRLCDPDEGVHCWPDRWHPTVTLKDWQKSYDHIGVEIIKFQREDDATVQIVNGALNYARKAGYDFGRPWEHASDVGYLIWLKDKDPSEQGETNEKIDEKRS